VPSARTAALASNFALTASGSRYGRPRWRFVPQNAQRMCLALLARQLLEAIHAHARQLVGIHACRAILDENFAWM
jgi:hypothetical protein